MLGRTYPGQDCSAARTLELVGERWSLLILRDAIFRGYTRYSEMQRSLDIAPNILARRLERLVDEGILDDGGGKAGEHSEYRLTEKGRDLAKVVIALTAWGDKWIEPGPIEYFHEECGGAVEQHLVCRKCGEVHKASAVAVRRPKSRRSRRQRAR
ncbi:MAG: winged helix-turn-helix transcriptional regulator [Gemmatimonadaceae bacterium]